MTYDANDYTGATTSQACNTPFYDRIIRGFVGKEKYMDCIMIPYDYGQPVPDLPDGDLIIVDVSFSTETFKKFLNEGRKILWIDHHISAIREFDKNLRYEVQNNPFFQFG
jgi:hypothetical protein